MEMEWAEDSAGQLTNRDLQPQPYAAIELIHKQPVRWTKSKVVSCDGGGGPLGHPKIFINTDKPEIATCGYCGLPFVWFAPVNACIACITANFLLLIGPRAPPRVPQVPAGYQLPPRAYRRRGRGERDPAGHGGWPGAAVDDIASDSFCRR